MIAAPTRRQSPHKQAAFDEVRWMLRQSRAPRLRSMLEFAQQEIVIPTGRFRGLKFKTERQPFTELLLSHLGRYQINVVTGPQQSGKTLIGFATPVLYHLFEIGETVIVGLPDLNMAGDKWENDLLPVIEQTRYKTLLPTSGEGSRGGSVKNAVRFTNGATLKFMTGGSSDKGRAGFTARVVVITEANAFGKSAETSEEANKYEQIIGRTGAYGSERRIYLECTNETEASLIWQMFLKGTGSRPVGPCPHCSEFVEPGREHLVGFQHAENEPAARAAARFTCPECKAPIDDEQRVQMNRLARLLHAGQEFDEHGQVLGEPPPTEAFSFRWSGFNNLFLTAGDFAVAEFNALRDPDEDNAERALCQFKWGIPYKPNVEEAVELQANKLINRIEKIPRAAIPSHAERVTVGVDMGKRVAHYIVLGTWGGFTGHVVDYGRFDVPSDSFGVDQAVMLALREFRDNVCSVGWTVEGGGMRLADQVWIDSGWMAPRIYEFIRETQEMDPDRYRPIKGWGAGQLQGQYYNRPQKADGKSILWVGENYHFVKDPAERITRVDIDANYWKTFLHARLGNGPADAHGNRSLRDSNGNRVPGTFSLFAVSGREHISFAKQLTAEKQQIEYVPDRGEVSVWRRMSRSNHWLDASYIACAAAHFGGMSLNEQPPPPPDTSPAAPAQRLETPDGRPFVALEREA